MEKLIDIFCHAIRITDPLSIKIAVGIVGGGLPLIFLVGLFIKLSDFVARQRETTVPNAPGKNPVPDTQIVAKERPADTLVPLRTSQPVMLAGARKEDIPSCPIYVRFTPKADISECSWNVR